MPKCGKCYGYLPPPFMVDMRDGGRICAFCNDGTNKMTYKGEPVTKEEIIKEYEIFMRMVKEKNEILRNAVDGDGVIPEKLI